MARFLAVAVVVASVSWIVAATGHLRAGDGLVRLAAFEYAVGGVCLAILCVPLVERLLRRFPPGG